MSNEILKNLFRLLSIAWRRRYLICIPMMIMPVVGLFVSFIAPKYYEAHTTILLQDTSELNPILEDFSVSTSLEERQAALKILLKSRKVLKAVATDMQYISKISTQQEIDDQIQDLSRSLSIVFGGELVKIYYRSENKRDIERLLKTVTTHFLGLVLAPQKSWQKTSKDFLKAQVDRQKTSLEKSEQALVDYKSQYALELPELHKANVTRLSELRQLLSEKKSDLAGAKAEVQEFNGNLEQTNPVIGKLEERLLQTKTELSILRSKYTDRHSKVQAALRSLERLEAERQRLIDESDGLESDDMQRLWSLAASSPTNTNNNNQGQSNVLASQLQAVQGANARVTGLENEVKSIEKMTNELLGKVQSFAEVERKLVELQRDRAIKQKLYDDFLNRYVMAQVTGDLGEYDESERVQIIDAPFTPSSPNKLPIALFVIAGLFAGLGIGTGLSAIAEISDTTIRLQDTIEKLAGVPVLTRIPYIDHAAQLAYEASSDSFGEEVGE